MSFGNCFLSKALLLLWSCINGREKNGQDFQVNVCINVCSNMGPRLSFQILTRQFSKIFFFFFLAVSVLNFRSWFMLMVRKSRFQKKVLKVCWGTSIWYMMLTFHSIHYGCFAPSFFMQIRDGRAEPHWFELEWPIIRFSEGWSVSNLITWLWGGLCSFSHPNNYNTNRRNGENLQTIVSFI